jgi:outer membrane immunogenic protein
VALVAAGWTMGCLSAQPPHELRHARSYTVNQPLNACKLRPLSRRQSRLRTGDPSITIRPSLRVFAGGVQAGYNWQTGPWVFGVEGDIQATGADDTFAPWKFSNPWFGTVRGRVGYAFNNIMFFGTGGLAFGELRGETFGLSESHTKAGWTVGAGAEFGLSQNWSAKIEYLYVDLANSNYHRRIERLPFRLVRAGVNYR